ncbi:PilZ domain-containing protein [Thermodesulfobacteriota bacterium]
MANDEKRIHARINALNLISYECMDETGQMILQGMGRTLNISEGGMLLETHVQIELPCTVSLAIGLEDDLINIKGTVVVSKPGEADKFESGIKFAEIGETELTVLKLFIQVFNEL